MNQNAYDYFPSFRSKRAELLGYRNLPDEDKDAIVPAITLTRWPRKESLSDAREQVLDVLDGRRFVMDTTKRVGMFATDSQALLNPDNAFAAWRGFVGDTDNPIIPVVQMTKQAGRRDIVRQAILLQQDYGDIAIKLRLTSPAARGLLLNVLSALDDPARLWIYLEAGYITQLSAPELAPEMLETIAKIREVDDTPLIISSSSSFPRSVADHGDESGVIPNLDRRFHDTIGGDAVCAYGDHSSVHVEPYSVQARGYVPRVDYATYRSWFYERRRPAKGGLGYIDAAKAIMEAEEFEPELNLWATEQIQAAAAGDLEGRGAPAFWISVRVNMHLHRQINYHNEVNFDDDFDDYDELTDGDE